MTQKEKLANSIVNGIFLINTQCSFDVSYWLLNIR